MYILKFPIYHGTSESETKDYTTSIVYRNHRQIKEPVNKSCAVVLFSDPLILVQLDLGYPGHQFIRYLYYPAMILQYILSIFN